jgi:signal transduction histidine kinase
MFEPYYTTKQGGTGLGSSSIAFSVVRLGGTLSVDSEPNGGTRVTLYLPLAFIPPPTVTVGEEDGP